MRYFLALFDGPHVVGRLGADGAFHVHSNLIETDAAGTPLTDPRTQEPKRIAHPLEAADPEPEVFGRLTIGLANESNVRVWPHEQTHAQSTDTRT